MNTVILPVKEVIKYLMDRVLVDATNKGLCDALISEHEDRTVASFNTHENGDLEITYLGDEIVDFSQYKKEHQVKSEVARWLSAVPPFDDFGEFISDEFIDGKTVHGPWAIMTPKSWSEFSGTGGLLGMGFGQRYMLDDDTGFWVRVEG